VEVIVCELEQIVTKYEGDYSPLLRDLEVYIAKKASVLFSEENNDYTRIFPKNGSHYIDIVPDYGIDDRIYIAIRKLYELGLTNYLRKLSFHEGTLRICVQSIYTKKEVKQEFDKHLKGCIENVHGDVWNYEFLDDL
jgi:hypothetical protein